MSQTHAVERRRPAPQRTIILLIALSLVVLSALPAYAGAQDVTIEPRTTLGLGLVISQPGSYTLDHDLTGEAYGVAIESSDVLLDGMGHAVMATNRTAVFISGSSAGSITNVTIRNLTARESATGISVGRVNGTVIEDVLVERNGLGIGCGYAAMGGAERVTVRDSVIRENEGAGIGLDYPSDGVTIERCTVTRNGKGIESDLSGRLEENLLVDSVIAENAAFGVSLKESGLVIRGCTVRGNGGNGIQIEHAGAEIVGNWIEVNAGIGVSSSDRGASNITANWITGNGQGVSLGGDWASRLVNNHLENADNGFFGAVEVGMLNVTKTPGPNIVGGPSLGGNYWAHPNGTGFSQTHPDTDGDGFCDEPYVVNVDEGVTDHLPLAMPSTTPGPIGGDKGFFLVSTVPAGAEVFLEDISGTRYLKGNTSAGPLNVTVMLTATPIRAVVATLPGYRDAVFNVTQYPPKGGTLPVSLVLEMEGGGATPYKPHAVPCRIEAEDYDLGGEGTAYHDTTAGNTGGAYRTDDVDIETVGSTTNVGWIRDGEWLTYTVNVTVPGTYTMTAHVASPNSGRTIAAMVDGTPAGTIPVPNTGSFATFQDVPVPVALPAGTHTLRLAFAGDGQNVDWLEFAFLPTPTPTVTFPVCGSIEAEDYTIGGEGVAYHDTTPGNSGGAYRQDDVDIVAVPGGYAVTSIEDGEWLNYTIAGMPPSSPMQPALLLYLGSDRDGGSVQVEVNGQVAGTVRVPNTGSPTTFRAVQTQVVAPTGTLRLLFHGSGMGMDRVEFPSFISFADDYSRPNFTANRTNGAAPLTVSFTDMSSEWAYEWLWEFGDGTGSTEQNPVHTFLRPGIYTVSLAIRESDRWMGGTILHIWNDLSRTKTVQVTVEGTGPTPVPVVPCLIQAEDYDQGGEGAAYHDTTAGNAGGAYRQDDVDIETAGGTTNVGWIRDGEWLTYTATVETAGQYMMTARVASPNSGRTFAVLVDGVSAGTIAVPKTGSFSTWRAVVIPVTLPAGTHTIRLDFAGDGQNLDWFAIGTGSPLTTTPTTPSPSGGASFTASPTTAPKGAAVKFTVTPASGKAVKAAWWSFDETAHLNTWNSRNLNPTFYYPAKGTFSPLVKLTYTDGSTETVQRTGYIRAT